MNKLEISDFKKRTLFLLEHLLAAELYKVYKKTNYSSFHLFNVGLTNGILLKKETTLNYIMEALEPFNMYAGFSKEFSDEFVIYFLTNKCYIKFSEIVKLEYELKK